MTYVTDVTLRVSTRLRGRDPLFPPPRDNMDESRTKREEDEQQLKARFGASVDDELLQECEWCATRR